MAVFHILENVNNFMQIFEFGDLLFIAMAILVELSLCLFYPFMAFIRYFYLSFRQKLQYKIQALKTTELCWINKQFM